MVLRQMYMHGGVGVEGEMEGNRVLCALFHFHFLVFHYAWHSTTKPSHVLVDVCLSM